MKDFRTIHVKKAIAMLTMLDMIMKMTLRVGFSMFGRVIVCVIVVYPQNEMFAPLKTRRSLLKNETYPKHHFSKKSRECCRIKFFNIEYAI